jgi:hypothetical protein
MMKRLGANELESLITGALLGVDADQIDPVELDLIEVRRSLIGWAREGCSHANGRDHFGGSEVSSGYT